MELQKKKNQKNFLITGILFLVFVLYTVLIKTVDVQAIGPENSKVGLATINHAVNSWFGESDFWYTVTKILGVVAFLVVGAFGLLGIAQLVTRKSLKKVDTDIIILGGFYVIVLMCYVIFEVVVVNYRPVIVDVAEGLEASYPSSHTMLVVSILGTAILQFRSRIPEKKVLTIVEIVSGIIIALMVIGRLVSGVHWFTDIVGGILISVALIMLYYSVVEFSKGIKKNGKLV